MDLSKNDEVTGYASRLVLETEQNLFESGSAYGGNNITSTMILLSRYTGLCSISVTNLLVKYV